MRPSRPQDLLAVALVTTVLANIVVRLSYGSLPAIPLFAGATLGVLGLAEAIAGNGLRARIQRRAGTRPVDALLAARALLVAKASALAGAVVAGVWLGLLAHAVPRSGDVAAAASDTASGLVGLVCAVGLVAGALWLEHCCRAPDDPEPGRDGPEGGGRAHG